MYPYAHTMVLLPMTRKNNYQPNVMACGGSLISTQVASNTCWKIELEKAGAKWEQVDNMPHGRVMPDSVILPDGKIAFVNGAGWGVAGGLSAGDAQYAGNPVLSADVFDPEAPAGKQWTVLANATVPRLYHSSAILIQSGQVMTAGSEMQNYVDVEAGKQECFPYGPNACTSPFEYRVELFSPPYMFSDKEKPVIKEAPARLTYDSVFVMTMSTNAIRVNKVNMIRFASSTHSINSDQRLVELEILGKTSDKIYLRAPKTGNLAPPGNWMVFALYDDVPSLSLRINLVNGEVTTVDVPEDAKASANTNAAQSSTFSIAGALFVSAAIAYFLS